MAKRSRNIHPSRLIVRTCPVCGRRFEGDLKRVTCSDACRQKRWRLNTNQGAPEVTRECACGCGIVFVTTFSTKRYATDRCRKRVDDRRRARERPGQLTLGA